MRAQHARCLPLNQLQLAALTAGTAIHPLGRWAGCRLGGYAPTDMPARQSACGLGTQNERDDRHADAQRQGAQGELTPGDLPAAEFLMQRCQRTLWSSFGHRGIAPLSNMVSSAYSPSRHT